MPEGVTICAGLSLEEFWDLYWFYAELYQWELELNRVESPL